MCLSKGYTIYRNDLKYKKNRSLDPNKIIWNASDKLKYLYDNIDLDSLEYRLHECKKGGMVNLDLSNMDLMEFPDIPLEYRSEVRCLFIAENDLECIPDLIDFKKLEILEVSNNSLHDVGRLPKTLIELSCRSNKLYSLPNPSECPNLERIDCTSNEIREILQYPKLKSLICNHNRISMIPHLENLEKLICSNNVINYIEGCNKIKYLDCSANKLIKLNDYYYLVDLICSNNNISDLLQYNRVKYLEIFYTSIKCIPYMENLEELYCFRDMVNKISNRYLSECNLDIKIHKETMLHIVFSKKQKPK
jgi:Leucine-rich repeat (LRR) protein